MEKRKGSNGLVEPPNRIYFSRIDDPHEFPKVSKIWVGHPAIARFIVRVLNWWSSKRTVQDKNDV